MKKERPARRKRAQRGALPANAVDQETLDALAPYMPKSGSEFDVAAQVGDLITTSEPFQRLLEGTRTARKLGTSRLQALVLSHYRDFIAASRAMHDVGDDLVALKKSVTSTRAAITSLSSVSLTASPSVETGSIAASQYAASYLGARQYFADAAPARSRSALNTLRDVVALQLAARNYDRATDHLCAALAEAQAHGFEAERLELEATVVQEIIKELEGLPMLAFHLHAPLLSLLLELGRVSEATAFFLKVHAHWIQTEQLRVLADSANTREVCLTVVEMTVAMAAHIVSVYRQRFYGADLARLVVFCSAQVRDIVALVAPRLESAFSVKPGTGTVAESRNTTTTKTAEVDETLLRTPLHIATSIVAQSSAHVAKLGDLGIAACSDIVVDELSPSLMRLIQYNVRRVEPTLEVSAVARHTADEPLQAILTSVGVIAGYRTDAVPQCDLWAEFICAMPLKLHGNDFTIGVEAYLSQVLPDVVRRATDAGAKRSTILDAKALMTGINRVRNVIGAMWGGRVFLSLLTESIALLPLVPNASNDFTETQAEAMHSVVQNPLLVDVVDAALQQLARTWLMEMRSARNILHEGAAAFEVQRAAVPAATPTAKREADADIAVFIPAHFIDPVDVRLVASAVSTSALLKVLRFLFSAHVNGVMPPHIGELDKRGDAFVRDSMIEQLVKTASPLTVRYARLVDVQASGCDPWCLLHEGTNDTERQYLRLRHFVLSSYRSEHTWGLNPASREPALPPDARARCLYFAFDAAAASKGDKLPLTGAVPLAVLLGLKMVQFASKYCATFGGRLTGVAVARVAAATALRKVLLTKRFWEELIPALRSDATAGAAKEQIVIALGSALHVLTPFLAAPFFEDGGIAAVAPEAEGDAASQPALAAALQSEARVFVANELKCATLSLDVALRQASGALAKLPFEMGRSDDSAKPAHVTLGGLRIECDAVVDGLC